MLQSVKYFESQNVTKHKMSQNTKCHKSQNVTITKFHKTQDALKHKISWKDNRLKKMSWNTKCHETQNVFKRKEEEKKCHRSQNIENYNMLETRKKCIKNQGYKKSQNTTENNISHNTKCHKPQIFVKHKLSQETSTQKQSMHWFWLFNSASFIYL